MAGSTLTTAAFILKRRYSEDVGDHTMRDHPLMTMISKSPGMTGPAAGWFYAITHSNPQGISGTFSSVVKSGSSGVQPVATRRKKYGIITLDREAMKACRDKGALLDLVTQETDGILTELGDNLAREAYGDGNGQLGRRSSASTNVITLTVANDSRNFKYGMTVIADDTATGATPRTGSTTVAGVDYDSGTVTLTLASSIDSFSDNDYLFRIGDPSTVIDGLAAHLPLTAPALGSDSFRGIDRGVDVLALSGARVNDTGTPIEENAGLVAVKINQGGQKAKQVFVNPINFWAAARRLNAKVTYEGGGGKATYGFEGIDIHSPAGTLRMYSDPDCPTNRGYVMNLDKWYWKHLDPFTHFIRDGNSGDIEMRVYNADEVEVRVCAMGNICSSLPGSSGVFAI